VDGDGRRRRNRERRKPKQDGTELVNARNRDVAEPQPHGEAAVEAKDVKSRDRPAKLDRRGREGLERPARRAGARPPKTGPLDDKAVDGAMEATPQASEEGGSRRRGKLEVDSGVVGRTIRDVFEANDRMRYA
jgi:hypothetical protein